MIVCICRRVSEKTIRAAICDGAQSVAEVTAACRAGGGCGACHEVIHEMIVQHASGDGRVHLPVLSPYLQASAAAE